MSKPQIADDGTLVYTVRITLKPGRDDDLINKFAGAPKRALAGLIRLWCRHGAGAADAAIDGDELDLSGLGEEI